MSNSFKKFLKETQRTVDEFSGDCSQIIDILQRIAGSEEYIKSFGVEYRTGKCSEVARTIEQNKDYVIFSASGRGGVGDVASGHFHFINRADGQCRDSYKLGWQTSGSNGFCQTFALMGALGLSDVFTGRNKKDCSIIACRYILSNNSRWKRKWAKLCKESYYPNIEKLTVQEIETDINTAIDEGIFWPLVQNEMVDTH